MQLNKLLQNSKNTVPVQTLEQLIISHFYGFFGVKQNVFLEIELHRTLWNRCPSANFLQQLLLWNTLITSDHLTKHSYNWAKKNERQQKAHGTGEYPGHCWDGFQIAPANKTTDSWHELSRQHRLNCLGGHAVSESAPQLLQLQQKGRRSPKCSSQV